MADPTAEIETNDLVEHALRGARVLLEADGAFRPHALTMAPDGELQVVFAESEEGTAQDDVEALRKFLGEEAEAGTLRAAALVLNTWIHAADRLSKRDAVVAIVEHSDGMALHAHQFYAIEERRGDVKPGFAVDWQERATEPIASSIFAAS